MNLSWILLYGQALHGVPGFVDFCMFHSSNDFTQLSSQGLQSDCGETSLFFHIQKMFIKE